MNLYQDWETLAENCPHDDLKTCMLRLEVETYEFNLLVLKPVKGDNGKFINFLLHKNDLLAYLDESGYGSIKEIRQLLTGVMTGTQWADKYFGRLA